MQLPELRLSAQQQTNFKVIVHVCCVSEIVFRQVLKRITRMLIQSSNNVKIYNLSAGKSLPEVRVYFCIKHFPFQIAI